MSVNKPTNGIVSLCSELGSGYSLSVIDNENVIHKKLNDYIDFEIRNVDYNSKSTNATLCIWHIHNHLEILETIPNIKSIEDLKNLLSTKATYYSNYPSIVSK